MAENRTAQVGAIETAHQELAVRPIRAVEIEAAQIALAQHRALSAGLVAQIAAMALQHGRDQRGVEPRLDEDRRCLARLWCHVTRSIRTWPKRLFGLMLRTIGRRRLIFGERPPVETVCKAVQHFFTISAQSSRP